MYNILVFTTLLYLGFITFSASEDLGYCDPELCETVRKSKPNKEIWHTGCPNNIEHDGKFRDTCSPDNVSLNPEMVTLSKEDKALILKLHNEQRNFVACGGLRPYGLRSACRIGALQWDDELVKTATFHAKRCVWGHDDCRNSMKYRFSGQNLGKKSFPTNNKANIVNIDFIKNLTTMWYEEYCFVKQETIDSFKKAEGPMIGHFLTSINERNTRIGCAAVTYLKYENKVLINRTSYFMLSCNYASTSVTGSAIYNSCQKPAAKCKNKDKTYPHLCSTDETYDWQSHLLELIPYDGNDKQVDGDCGEPPEGKNKVNCPSKASAASGSDGQVTGGSADGVGSGGDVGAVGGGSSIDTGVVGDGGGSVGFNDDDDYEYFDYSMGPYPGFSATFPWSQSTDKKLIFFSIIFTWILVS